MTQSSYNPTEQEGSPELLLQEKIRRPKMYQVLLHNDNYTTMEFVVSILMKIFRKTMEQATSIMLSVHRKGIGVAGVYTRELAETKVNTTHMLAREAGFPLRCTLQEVDE